jgi:predicted DNA-binding protein (UPF0251 family)
MSPRTKKPRICSCPIKGRAFKPAGMPLSGVGKVFMRREEIEALKLCDAEGLTQKQAGARMGISRGTVQRILAEARRKTAEALSECKAIILDETICR